MVKHLHCAVFILQPTMVLSVKNDFNLSSCSSLFKRLICEAAYFFSFFDMKTNLSAVSLIYELSPHEH